MPRLMDTRSRAESLAVAINVVLARHGISGLTLRRVARVAREAGLSHGTILDHLDSRERLLRVCGGIVGDWLVRDAAARSVHEGVTAFLPRDAGELEDTRCWLAWLELARSEPHLGAHLGRHEDDERACLARIIERRPTDRAARLVHATLVGLRHALVRTDDPLPLADAREILTSSAELALRLPLPPPPQPRAAG